MTTNDVLQIAGIVAVAQCICDLLSRRLVFSREPYKRAVSTFDRAKIKRDKIVAASKAPLTTPSASSKQGKVGSLNSEKAADKQAKKIQRAEDDLAEAASEVAKRHTGPTFLGSIVFVVLYRILNAEYSGRVVAVLPFQPWSIVRRLSMRGISMEDDIFAPLDATVGAMGEKVPPAVASTFQACSFLFIYVLCTMSVKFIVHTILGVKPPKGADGGIGTLLDAPKSQRVLQSFGVDPEELKEARKAF